jgi:hypothetical protein
MIEQVKAPPATQRRFLLGLYPSFQPACLTEASGNVHPKSITIRALSLTRGK